MQEPQNGGRQEGTPNEEARPLFGGTQSGTTPGRTTGSGTMSAQDEQTWSMVAHLSVLAALVGLMPLGALIVWLIYKDRSPRVRFHALQALWYQIAWLVLIVAYTFVSALLTLVVIGVFMFFLLPLIALIPIAHGCYAAYKVYKGEDFRYPFIADWIDGGRRTV
jgi:uncharacterized Tic20 family protein